MPMTMIISSAKLTHLIRNRYTETASSRLIDFLRNLVFKHPLFHPAHGEQVVERREQPVPYAVIALAGEARIVADLNLRDRVAFDLEQRWQETMHAFEKFQVFD